MPIYIFGCSQGHRTEAIRPVGTATSACGVCDEQDCGRVYQYSVALTQPEADVRGMTRRFIEASEEMSHNTARQEAQTGQSSAPDRLWQRSLAKAQALRATGEGDFHRSW